MKRAKRAACPPTTTSTTNFEARCLELIDAVERTRRSIIVTTRGRAVAMLVPIRVRRPPFGFMKGRIEILGDIVSPIDETWDAEQ